MSKSSARESLELSCWAWVKDLEGEAVESLTPEHLFLAYRLHFPVQTEANVTGVKRAARFNPKCSVGEEGFLFQLSIPSTKNLCS